MKNIIIYIISIVLVVTAVILFLVNSKGEDDVSSHLLTVKARADATQVPYNSNSSQVPNYNGEYESLTEIVVSPEDLKSADSNGLIGSQPAYNSSYITEEDVTKSIERILSSISKKIADFSPEYHDYLINLRHIEMVEGVSESQSNILRVAEEYDETSE